MSGSTIGGVVGGVIGFYAGNGNPQAVQAGWMIGSAVGGYVDPDVIKGQRLNDAQIQTSNEGVPRPIIYGTAVVSGNIIQSGPLVETKHSDRTGKGGPVQESFRYSRTYAIRVCEGPVAGISRIWRDDKLVYDTRDPADWPDDAQAITDLAADTASFSTKLTIFTGDESQLPSASLEALPAANGGGSGNVPAYRGTCYVVFTDDDLTDRQGTIPQYRFEVSVCGDITPGVTVSPLAAKAVMWLEMDDGSAEDGFFDSASPSEPASLESHAADPNQYIEFGTKLFKNGTNSVRFIGDGSIYPTCLRTPNAAMNASMEGQAFAYSIWFSVPASSTVARHCLLNRNAELSSSYTFIYVDNDTGAIEFILNDSQGPPDNISFTSSRTELTGGSPHLLVLRYDGAGTYYIYIDGVQDSTVSHPSSVGGGSPGATSFIGAVQGGEVSDGFFEQAAWFIGDIGEEGADILWNNGEGTDFGPLWGGTQIPDSPDYYVRDGVLVGPGLSTVGQCSADLADIISDLCERAGIDADHIDVTDAVGVDVRGFTVIQMAASEPIRTLQTAFLFDFPEWGDYTDDATKLRVVNRGGATSLDITDDDLVESDDDEEARAQAVEFPRKINLTVPDPLANYEPAKQTSERRTENVKAVGEMSVQLPVVMTRDESAKLVDKMLRCAWTESEGRCEFDLPEEFSNMVPSDTFTKSGKRWRATEIEYADGQQHIKAVRDRVSNYTSNATGSTGVSPTAPTSNMRGPTVFAAWNGPSLRTADNVPGIYVAARGVLPGWNGCRLQLSVDGGTVYSAVLDMTAPATIGWLTAAVDADDEPIPVDVYRDTLETVTDAQIAVRANAFALITDDVCEIGQFKTATETSTGKYDLTDVTRGELDTTAAGHSARDQFVLLDSAVYFLPIDVSLAGKTLYLRPVTFGTAEANNPAYPLVFAPVFTSGPSIDFLETNTGDVIRTDAGLYIQVTTA